MIMIDKNTCKYYKGYQGLIGNRGCQLDINIRKMIGGDNIGWMTRIPCVITGLSKNVVACKNFTEWNDKEIANNKKKTKLIIEAMEASISGLTTICPECGLTIIQENGTGYCPNNCFSFRSCKTNEITQ